MREVRLIALAASVVFPACSGCASGGKPRTDLAPKPDTSLQIRVVGRWSTASACPIGPRMALTAAHVVDPRPFDKTPYSPVAFQQGETVGTFTVLERKDAKGAVLEQMVSRSRDLAYVESNVELVGWYHLAEKAPQPGATVYFYGLDWRNKKNAFAERVWTATVLRTVAGIVIYDPAGEPGTSGSCVLNEDGQVVAVNTGGMLVGPREARALGHGNEVGIGVGVWLGLGAAN
jgi:V8-like Glu-specific endopeptidase